MTYYQGIKGGAYEWFFHNLSRIFSLFFTNSPSATLVWCSFGIMHTRCVKGSCDDSGWIPAQYEWLWGCGRMRRGEKGVTLQAGKTDYSDCRRVRLAGWATPSFWQRWIPLVMSSNERAFFIPRSWARGMYKHWKKGGKRAEKTGKGEKKRGKWKQKSWKRARLSKNSACIIKYAASRAYLKGNEKTVSGLRMIEIDGRTIDPGQRILPRSKLRALTSLTRAGKYGTKTGIEIEPWTQI